MDMILSLEQTLSEFCRGFLINPHVSYTEHGIHAEFYHNLVGSLPEDIRYGLLDGRRLSIVQKEYPTHEALGKSRRQHWDIAIADLNLANARKTGYDHMPLIAAVEFGMNEPKSHLIEDLRRLNEDTNVQAGYAVHLFRISDGWSSRDRKPKTKIFIEPQEAQMILISRATKDKSINIFYCSYGRSPLNAPNPCVISDDGIRSL